MSNNWFEWLVKHLRGVDVKLNACFHIYNHYSGVLASLNTTASSRSKSSSVTSKNEDDTLAKANTKNSLESSKSKVCTKDVRKGVSGGKNIHDPWHTQSYHHCMYVFYGIRSSKHFSSLPYRSYRNASNKIINYMNTGCFIEIERK